MMFKRSAIMVVAILAVFVDRVSAAETPEELLAAATTAVAADDYAKARDLLAKAAAAAGRNAAARAEIADLRREIGSIQKEYGRLERERGVLKTSPSDRGANQALGEFYAFSKGDWDTGLPLLARGNDELMRTAAASDLRKPATVKDQLAVGDHWQSVAEQSRDAKTISRATLRARFWYLSAADGATEDADRQAINERLDKLRLYPSKVVIVNSHNGHYNDRGTLIAELVFLLDGQSVLTRRVTLPWKEGESVPTTVRVPRTRADALQVNVLKWQGLGGTLAEIEAYQDGINLAAGAPATASGEHDAPYRAGNVTDGDYGGEFEQGGIWVLPDNEAGWVRIMLDQHE